MILFRSQDNKIPKMQTGGEVPVYASFKIKEDAGVKPYDPTALLQKYKAAIPPVSEAKPAEVDKEAVKALKGEGLANDINRIVDEHTQLVADYKYKVANLPGFVDSPEGVELLSQINFIGSAKLNEATQLKSQFQENKKVLKDQRGGDNPVYSDGQFLYKTYDRDENGNVKVNPDTGKPIVLYTEGTPDKMNEVDKDGNALYGIVTYSELGDVLESNPAFDLNELGIDKKFRLISRLSAGMDNRYIQDTFIDPYFKDIGEVSNNTLITTGGEVITANDIEGYVLKERTEEQGTTENINQLSAALESAKSDMPKSAREAMEAHAWRTIPQPTQKKVNDYIKNQLLLSLTKRVKVDKKVTEKLIKDYKATQDKLTGGAGSTATGNASIYLVEAPVGTNT